MISTVLLAEDMGLEPKETLVCCCLLLSALGLQVLEFQGFERVSVGIAGLQEM